MKSSKLPLKTLTAFTKVIHLNRTHYEDDSEAENDEALHGISSLSSSLVHFPSSQPAHQVDFYRFSPLIEPQR